MTGKPSTSSLAAMKPAPSPSSAPQDATPPVYFCDLNILHDLENPAVTADAVRMAIRLGYNVVGINVDIGCATEELGLGQGGPGGAERKKKIKLKDIPEPFCLPPVDITTAFSLAGRPDHPSTFRQYTRISTSITESGFVHTFLTHPMVSRYDLVAIYPPDEMIFNAVLRKPEVDLLTFDPTERPVWLTKSKLINAAVSQFGLTFELCYSPTLTDDRDARRQVFSNARDIWNVTRGKGMILSSGALKPGELRGPYDVANMAMAMGMKATEGMRTLTKIPMKTVMRLETKKTIRGVMHVQPVADAPPQLVTMLRQVRLFKDEFVCRPPTKGDDEKISKRAAIKQAASETEPPKKKAKKAKS